MGITGPETLLGQAVWWVPCPCFSLGHPEQSPSPTDARDSCNLLVTTRL